MSKSNNSEQTQSNFNLSSWISSGKDLMALLRDAALFLLAVLLLALPNTFNNVLTKAGFEEGSLVGFKWKAKLLNSDQALKDAQQTINNLKKQLDKTSQALAETKAQINDRELQAKISNIQQENKQLETSSTQVETTIQNTISSNAPLVEKAQTVINQNAKWGVVFGGDTTLEAAQYEIDKATKKGIKPTSIFFRQGSFRSVAAVDNKSQADQILLLAKDLRSDSYIVNMTSWCPQTIDKVKYQECISP